MNTKAFFALISAVLLSAASGCNCGGNGDTSGETEEGGGGSTATLTTSDTGGADTGSTATSSEDTGGSTATLTFTFTLTSTNSGSDGGAGGQGGSGGDAGNGGQGGAAMTTTDTTAMGGSGGGGGGDPPSVSCWQSVTGVPGVWNPRGGIGMFAFGGYAEGSGVSFAIDPMTLQGAKQMASSGVTLYVDMLADASLALGYIDQTEADFVLEDRENSVVLDQLSGSPAGLCAGLEGDVYIAYAQGQEGTVEHLLTASPWTLPLLDFVPTIIRCFGGRVFVGGTSLDGFHLYEVTGGSSVEISVSLDTVTDLVGFSADDLWLSGTSAGSPYLSHLEDGQETSLQSITGPETVVVEIKSLAVANGKLSAAGMAVDVDDNDMPFVVRDLLGVPVWDPVSGPQFISVGSYWIDDQGREYFGGYGLGSGGYAKYKVAVPCDVD